MHTVGHPLNCTPPGLLPCLSVSLVDLLLAFQVFKEAIKAAITYKENSTDFIDEVMRELEVR